MTGHLGFWVVRLATQQISKIGEVIAVVDEARDELSFVLKNKNRGVGAAGGDAADERGVEDQMNFPRLRQGAAVAFLAPPADLSHQPRQHGQSGPPVQRGPADVSQDETPVVLLNQTLHVETADFRRCGGGGGAGGGGGVNKFLYFKSVESLSFFGEKKICGAIVCPKPAGGARENLQQFNTHSESSPMCKTCARPCDQLFSEISQKRAASIQTLEVNSPSGSRSSSVCMTAEQSCTVLFWPSLLAQTWLWMASV